MDMLSDTIAGWLQGNVLLPLMYQFGLMQWEDISYGWALFAVYGAFQVIVTFAVCLPLEMWQPVEKWPTKQAVVIDAIYTFMSRVGVLPLVYFVLFYELQVTLNAFLTDHGWVPPTLERFFPFLLGHQVATFFVYVIILDFFDYWRHRFSHEWAWWYSLHAVHHAQRQMTFWSDDRNHLLDEIISFLWFLAIALAIGIPPMQFPLMVLLLRFLESMSHANAKIHFGWLGERLLVSPRFHRAHHAIGAAGAKSVNYGAILPWWDMLFRTADFHDRYAPTGDPTAEEAMATGSWFAQQWAGFRRLLRGGAVDKQA
jgi:sterol desaturase/sphingolipid hydroxylase (fatty acid hydroxylase superfamily)